MNKWLHLSALHNSVQDTVRVAPVSYYSGNKSPSDLWCDRASWGQWGTQLQVVSQLYRTCNRSVWDTRWRPLLQSSEGDPFGGFHFFGPWREVLLYCTRPTRDRSGCYTWTSSGRLVYTPLHLETICHLTPLFFTQVALLPSSTPPPPSFLSTLSSPMLHVM